MRMKLALQELFGQEIRNNRLKRRWIDESGAVFVYLEEGVRLVGQRDDSFCGNIDAYFV